MNQNEKTFLDQLDTQYRDLIYYLAFQYVNQEEAAENIVLKIFSSVVDNRSILIRFHIEQMPFILCAMTRYLIMKYSRKTRTALFSCYLSQANFLSCEEKDPMEDSDLAEWIACLKKIPIKELDLFLLFYDCGLTYNEISDLLGLSVTSVRRRIAKANKLFWNAMEKKKGLKDERPKRFFQSIKRD